MEGEQEYQTISRGNWIWIRASGETKGIEKGTLLYPSIDESSPDATLNPLEVP